MIGRFFPVADEQGTPVEIRDGPAAVTECHEENRLSCHCRCDHVTGGRLRDEKAGFSSSEVRRPTSAKRAAVCEGQGLRRLFVDTGDPRPAAALNPTEFALRERPIAAPTDMKQ